MGTTAESELRARLAAFAPDEPRTVELHALLWDPGTQILGDARGAVLVAEQDSLLGVVGAPPADALPRALSLASDGWQVLSLERPRARELAWRRAIVHVHDGSTRLAEAVARALGRVRRVTPADLASVPTSYRAELVRALGDGEVVGAFSEGVLASFSYAATCTPKHFDVSIDTLEGYRGRGLAKLAAAALVDRVKRTGRAPVWCALEGNAASIAVARALGFAFAGDLWVAEIERVGG